MVVSAEIIKKNAVFHVAWVLGTGDSSKVSRREILSQNLPELCDSIISMVPEKEKNNARKAGLYLLSLLTYGTVRIHRVQVDFLKRDVEKLKELMRKKSFVMIFAERFDREHELKKDEENRQRLRSTPIARVEDIDDLVDLANLPRISAEIGINGDPRDFTMMDALPNFSQWMDTNSELAGLYGPIEQFSSQKDYTMHSTFVEGNGSNERDNVAQLTQHLEEFVHVPIREESRKRQPPMVEVEIHQEKPDETLQFAQCSLFDRTIPIVDEPKDLEGSVVPADETLKIFQCSLLGDSSVAAPQAPPTSEDLDLVVVPPSMQEKVASYLEQIGNLPPGCQELPPFPKDLDLLAPTSPPPKKRRIEEEPEDVERARRRPSSRPITPQNRTDLTDFNTMTRVEDQSFQLDSQIEPAPSRKGTKRVLKPFYGDDIEIDVSVQKVLMADYSGLVRRKEDVMIQQPTPPEDFASLMTFPEPFVHLGKRFCREIGELFETTKFRENGPFGDVSDSEEEEEEKFAKCYLASPERIREETALEEIQKELNIPENQEIVNELQLEPIPIPQPAPIIEDLEFPVPRIPEPEPEPAPEVVEKKAEDEDVENIRRRQKSSLGIGGNFGRTKRVLKPFYGDDIEIDVSVQKVLMADYSGLVRRKEDVVIQQPTPPEDFASLMTFPEPFVHLGKRFCREIGELFETTKYRENGPFGDVSDSEEEEEEKFAKCYLASPERIREETALEEIQKELNIPENQEIVNELQLEPIPFPQPAPIIEDLEFPVPRIPEPAPEVVEKKAEDEDVENIRRRQKSSLGIGKLRDDAITELDTNLQTTNQEDPTHQNIPRVKPFVDEDLEFFSSGSLLPNNRLKIHGDLLIEAEKKYPDWLSFDEFTAEMDRKSTAIAFEGLLLGLKNLKVRSKQDAPFSTIFVQHVEI